MLFILLIQYCWGYYIFDDHYTDLNFSTRVLYYPIEFDSPEYIEITGEFNREKEMLDLLIKEIINKHQLLIPIEKLILRKRYSGDALVSVYWPTISLDHELLKQLDEFSTDLDQFLNDQTAGFPGRGFKEIYDREKAIEMDNREISLHIEDYSILELDLNILRLSNALPEKIKSNQCHKEKLRRDNRWDSTYMDNLHSYYGLKSRVEKAKDMIGATHADVLGFDSILSQYRIVKSKNYPIPDDYRFAMHYKFIDEMEDLDKYVDILLQNLSKLFQKFNTILPSYEEFHGRKFELLKDLSRIPYFKSVLFQFNPEAVSKSFFAFVDSSPSESCPCKRDILFSGPRDNLSYCYQDDDKMVTVYDPRFPTPYGGVRRVRPPYWNTNPFLPKSRLHKHWFFIIVY